MNFRLYKEYLNLDSINESKFDSSKVDELLHIWYRFQDSPSTFLKLKGINTDELDEVFYFEVQKMYDDDVEAGLKPEDVITNIYSYLKKQKSGSATVKAVHEWTIKTIQKYIK